MHTLPMQSLKDHRRNSPTAALGFKYRRTTTKPGAARPWFRETYCFTGEHDASTESILIKWNHFINESQPPSRQA
jgi:hypothetical protein